MLKHVFGNERQSGSRTCDRKRHQPKSSGGSYSLDWVGVMVTITITDKVSFTVAVAVAVAVAIAVAVAVAVAV